MALESVEREIRVLRDRLRSQEDPEDRTFAPLTDALRRAGQLDEARELLDAYLPRHPEYATGHVVAGLLYKDLGDSARAREALSRVLELDSENVVALDAMAELAQAHGLRDEALGYLRELVELDPSHPTAREHLQELEEVPASQEAVSSEPEPEVVESPPEVEVEEPVESIAEAEESLAETEEPVWEEAEEPFAEVVEPEWEVEEPAPEIAEPVSDSEPRTEDDDEVYTRTMAELYLRQGLPERAIRVYRQLVAESPDDPELQARLQELEGAAETPDPGPSEPEPTEPEPLLEAGGMDFPASEASLGQEEFTLDELVSEAEAAANPPLEGLQSPVAPETDPGSDPGELEVAAPQWADPGGPGTEAEAASPWGEDPDPEPSPEEVRTGAGDGPPVSRYFEVLLSWVPGAVPVESLAPDEVTKGAAPGDAPAFEGDAPVSEGDAPAAEEEETVTTSEEEAAPDPTPAPSREDPPGEQEARGEEGEDDDDDEDEFQAWLRSLQP